MKLTKEKDETKIKAREREEFILEIPNVSFVQDTDSTEQNVSSLLNLINEDYLFACGDIFTKIWEDEREVEWGCKNSFMKISVERDGSDYCYGEANMLPNDITYYE